MKTKSKPKTPIAGNLFDLFEAVRDLKAQMAAVTAEVHAMKIAPRPPRPPEPEVIVDNEPHHKVDHKYLDRLVFMLRAPDENRLNPAKARFWVQRVEVTISAPSDDSLVSWDVTDGVHAWRDLGLTALKIFLLQGGLM